MTRPEQPVIDEIDRLVSWQIEEGQRRGDGPERSIVDFLSDFDGFLAEFRRLRELVDAVEETPPLFKLGDRVGWQDMDGTVHVGIVESYVEDPPKSGQWQLTTRPE